MSSSSNSTASKKYFKIVLLGNSGVGKTALIERFFHNKFENKENPTIGIDFVGTNVTISGQVYRVQLWDTAGQERYRSLIPIYLRDAAAAVFVFDITCNPSFTIVDQSLNDLESWIELYKESRADKSIMVTCGNKMDLKSKQTYNEDTLKFLIHKHQMKHFLVSALSGLGVAQMFQQIVKILHCEKKKKTRQFDITTNHIIEPHSSQNLNALQMKTNRSNGEKVEDGPQKYTDKEQQKNMKIDTKLLKDKAVSNKIQGENRCC